MDLRLLTPSQTIPASPLPSTGPVLARKPKGDSDRHVPYLVVTLKDVLVSG